MRVALHRPNGGCSATSGPSNCPFPRAFMIIRTAIGYRGHRYESTTQPKVCDLRMSRKGASVAPLG
jgi:hypothetical protein